MDFNVLLAAQGHLRDVSKLIFREQSTVWLNYGDTDLKALRCNSKRRRNNIPTNNQKTKQNKTQPIKQNKNKQTNKTKNKKQNKQKKKKNSILISSQIVKDDQV